MIKCVAFDLDNTLWDIDPVIKKAEQCFYQWLDVNYPIITANYSAAEIVAHRIDFMQSQPEESRHDLTFLRKSWMTKLADGAVVDDQYIEGGFEVFWLARNKVEFYEGAIDILEGLANRYSLGVISNGNADVHLIGIGHLFDFTLSSEQAGVAKPHQDIFDQALKLSKAEMDEIVYVGDDPKRDVLGALNAGMRAIWYNPTSKPWPGGRTPSAVIRNHSELEGVLAQFK